MFLGSILSLGPGKSNGPMVDQYKARNMAKTDTTSRNNNLSGMVALLQPRVQFVGNMEENLTGHRCGCGHEVPLHQHRQQRAHMQQNDMSQSNPFGGGPNHSIILMHVHCKHVLGPSNKISVRDSYVWCQNSTQSAWWKNKSMQASYMPFRNVFWSKQSSNTSMSHHI